MINLLANKIEWLSHFLFRSLLLPLSYISSIYFILYSHKYESFYFGLFELCNQKFFIYLFLIVYCTILKLLEFCNSEINFFIFGLCFENLFSLKKSFKLYNLEVFFIRLCKELKILSKSKI